MKAFDLGEIAQRREAADRPYFEFLRVPDLSVGLYVLPAGSDDGQSPHAEDEIYYVVSGSARIRVADQVRDVGPGSIVFVDAHVPHRFEGISETLTVLVVFGPAEGSRGAS